MAPAIHSSSEEDEIDLMRSFQKGAERNTQKKKQQSFSLGSFISNGTSVVDDSDSLRSGQGRRTLTGVRVSPVRDREEYIYYDGEDTVHCIRREISRRGNLHYEVEFVNGTDRQVSFEDLLSLDNGPEALDTFRRTNDGVADSDSADSNMRDSRLRSRVNKTKHDGFISVEGLDLSSDEEVHERKQRRKRLSAVQDGSGRNSKTSHRTTTFDSSESESEESVTRRRHRRRKAPQEPMRRSSRMRLTAAYDDDEDDDDDDDDEDDDDNSSIDLLQSDLAPRKRKRGRPAGPPKPEKVPRVGMRQSGRATRAQNNMEEADIDDIYRSDSDVPKVATIKITNAKETFETLPRTNLFRSRHVEACEVCKSGNNVAPLIYCQGCSCSYHKNCIGNRSSRDHLVTKVSDEYYILQCRRCVNIYRKKDKAAPDLSMCQDCHHSNPACEPFRPRKTTVQEQKDRDANNGVDPVVDVPSNLINNARNVLFRCSRCARAWHYHHLPPLSPYAIDIQRDEDETADERFLEYSKIWVCKDCKDTEDKSVESIIAWRPSDVETYQPGTSCYEIPEDEKQYLVKWKEMSYFRAAWFSGAWTWGVTAPQSRTKFFEHETGPKMRTEDAIPEEFLRIDIVLDIKFTSYVDVRSEEIDKARIKEVDRALVKYKGLGYEDTVWEKAPTPEDGDRWLDFVAAYNDWVAGRYLRYPKQGPLKARLEKARAGPFSALEKKKQPECLVGGELMNYQLDGLNWIYYQWYLQKNGILADEMGLGKTIQVIAFMAALVEDHSCYPFLIVVPNATAANWRREIKQWVPSLRVVTFFGGEKPREMARKYEMYPEGSKDLRAHIVVTSYETAIDPGARRLFKSVSWAGLIVDEGQRLKNDKSQSHEALAAIRTPFRLLLTGTPLQNNARELFNLLQFLDDNIDAAELEEKYTEMTAENVRELHEQIRPYILRRTKAQVLTFLPPLGQVIVPVSMSVLQKSLYKSILARNPELLKALFTSGATRTKERANLSNILMQLRKCLCHPFVYESEIEERTDIQAVSHRNLVEASAKFQLLELLLPKLKERGHRVLIFSQFLDMLMVMEDFLDGMQMPYTRLDGNTRPLEKQKRIDLFNAPDSPLFAFLISTRAGGVGINLATADTVIILDPDFNPHQDLQAISRAHRIGQKNKVLCFQLMTRSSCEEKIVQMGRKKMALDHVVVEQMGEQKIEDEDVDSILKFGAAELFKDENTDQDIRYDDASIDKLLDRSQIENTRISNDASAESQFSFARVWANDQGTLQDDLDTPEEEVAPPDPGVWDKILQERREIAAAEALARAEALGRGKRNRAVVNYEADATRKAVEGSDNESLPPSPVKTVKIDKRSRKQRDRSESEDDTDFRVTSDEEDSDGQNSGTEDVDSELNNLDTADTQQGTTAGRKSLYDQHNKGASGSSSYRITPKSTPKNTTPTSKSPPVFPSITLFSSPSKVVKGKTGARHITKPHSPHKKYGSVLITKGPPPRQNPVDLPRHKPEQRKPKTNPAVKPFERAKIPVRSHANNDYRQQPNVICPACYELHPQGACALKVAGVEHCGLCGLAHFGIGRTCPHIKSETQVREMLIALKSSPEKKELVDMAIKYLRGVKGHLVQAKKKEKEAATETGMTTGTPGGMSFMMEQPTNSGNPQATAMTMGMAGGMPYMLEGPVNPGQQQANVYNISQGQGFNTPREGNPQQSSSRTGPGNAGHRAPTQYAQHVPGGAGNPSKHGGHQKGSARASDATQIDDQHVESALRGFLGRTG